MSSASNWSQCRALSTQLREKTLRGFEPGVLEEAQALDTRVRALAAEGGATCTPAGEAGVGTWHPGAMMARSKALDNLLVGKLTLPPEADATLQQLAESCQGRMLGPSLQHEMDTALQQYKAEAHAVDRDLQEVTARIKVEETYVRLLETVIKLLESLRPQPAADRSKQDT